MIKVFISYSHADELQKEKLDTHLATLKRERKIEAWHDRKLLAGSPLNNEIDQNLLESNIVLLLLSPDFLASDYCYCKEMQKALEMRDESKMHIIPIIINCCDWLNTPLKELVAVPKDGKPVVEYANPDKAFLEITTEIRKVVDSLDISKKSKVTQTSQKTTSSSTNLKIVDHARSSNLRIKKEFTDYDKNKFRKKGFEYISKFFRNSLEELRERNENIDINFEIQDANSFIAAVYKSGSMLSQCMIINRIDSSMSFGGITFSTSLQRNSCNGGITVDHDYIELFFVPTMFYNSNENKMSAKGAAEYLWEQFMEPLRR